MVSISLQGNVAVVHSHEGGNTIVLNVFDIHQDRIAFSLTDIHGQCQPVWSPDGRFMVLSRWPDQSSFQVYGAAKWGVLSTIGTFGRVPISLAWSPTGTCITYRGILDPLTNKEQSHVGLIDFAPPTG